MIVEFMGEKKRTVFKGKTPVLNSVVLNTICLGGGEKYGLRTHYKVLSSSQNEQNLVLLLRNAKECYS